MFCRQNFNTDDEALKLCDSLFISCSFSIQTVDDTTGNERRRKRKKIVGEK